MELQKYMVEFRIMDVVDLPDDTIGGSKGVIERILSYCELNNIDEVGYHFDHGEYFDNHEDDQETIAQTDTLVTIRFEADNDAIHLVDDHDPAHLLYVAALKELKKPGAYISNCYYNEQGPFSRTVIEITTYER